MRSRIPVLLLYVILAVTFASILSISMDRHFEEMVLERIEFRGWGGHTLARVVSPVIVLLISKTGFSATTSAFIYIGASTMLLLLAYSGYLEQGTAAAPASSSALSALILVPMVWNYSILSSAHYIDDVPAILFFVMGLKLLHNRTPPPPCNLICFLFLRSSTGKRRSFSFRQ